MIPEMCHFLQRLFSQSLCFARQPSVFVLYEMRGLPNISNNAPYTTTAYPSPPNLATSICDRFVMMRRYFVMAS